MSTKILIIDDNNAFRKTLVIYLKKEFKAIEITEGCTGEEGVSLAANVKPDIILMDIRLPRMDGITAAEVIKKTTPNCVIFILSLFAGEMRKENNISNAINDIVGKNEIEKKLIPLLRKHMRNFRKRKEAP